MKVQGRFFDIPYSVAIDEVVFLLAEAIKGRKINTAEKKNIKVLSQRCEIRFFKKLTYNYHLFSISMWSITWAFYKKRLIK